MFLHSAVLKEIKRRSAAEFVRTRQAALSSCRDVLNWWSVFSALAEGKAYPPMICTRRCVGSFVCFFANSVSFFLFSFPGFQGTIFRMSVEGSSNSLYSQL